MGKAERKSRQRETTRPRSNNTANGSESSPTNSPRQKSKVGRLALLGITLLVLAGVLLWSGQLGGVPRSNAKKAIVEHRYQDAQDALAWAETLSPGDYRTDLLQARLARHQGDADQLSRALDQAKLHGASTDAIELERLLALAQVGELDLAEGELIDALTLPDADMAEISDALSNGLATVGRFDEAINVLVAWRDDYPSDPRASYRLGRILEHREQYDDAEKNYREALGKHPQFYPAIFSLGRVMLHQRRVEEAVAQFERCLSMPRPEAAKIEMAVALKSLGKGDEAAKWLKEALDAGRDAQAASYAMVEESPEGYRAAAEYGRLQADAGNFEEALPWLKAALKDNPLDLTVRYSLGVTLRGLGKLDEAEAHFTHVREARDAMGVANALNERIKRDPADVEARYQLGKLVLENESERIGIYWLRSIFAFDPDYAPAHELLASYYDRKAHSDPKLRPRAEYHHRRAQDLAVPTTVDETETNAASANQSGTRSSSTESN